MILRSLMSARDCDRLDLFDRVQLAAVVRVCQSSSNLSDAGRKLFAATREMRKKTNDADRLSKYLARFGLDWPTIKQARG